MHARMHAHTHTIHLSTHLQSKAGCMSILPIPGVEVQVEIAQQLVVLGILHTVLKHPACPPSYHPSHLHTVLKHPAPPSHHPSHCTQTPREQTLHSSHHPSRCTQTPEVCIKVTLVQNKKTTRLTGFATTLSVPGLVFHKERLKCTVPDLSWR